MPEWYLIIAIILLINMLIGLLRISRGPTQADGLLAVQLFGTTLAALLVLLAEVMEMPALRDVALLFTLLAALFSVAFVRLPARAEEGPEHDA